MLLSCHAFLSRLCARMNFFNEALIPETLRCINSVDKVLTMMITLIMPVCKIRIHNHPWRHRIAEST